MDIRSESKATRVETALVEGFEPGKCRLDNEKSRYLRTMTGVNIQNPPIQGSGSGAANKGSSGWPPLVRQNYQEKIVTLSFWKTGFITD